MDALERKAIDFGKIVQEILKQFQAVHGQFPVTEECDLGFQDVKAIEILGEMGPQMMRSMASHLGLAVNSLTTVVDHLEAKGLAVRTRSQTDRRVINVELTEEGQRVFQMTSDSKLKFHRALLGALTEDEQDILLVLFRKIAREGSKQVESLATKD